MKKYQFYKKIILTFSICFIVLFGLFGQTKPIQIQNTKNEDIPFVNLYAIQSDYGTISDVNGIVTLDFAKIQKLDTIQITCIGYEDRFISIDTLLKVEDGKLFLKEVAYKLDGIYVKEKKLKYKSRKTGVKTTLNLCQYGFFTQREKAGKEAGVIMKNDDECYLESIHFNLVNVTDDSMIYELNIYDYDEGVKSTINTERIFIEINKNEPKISVNVRDQNIKISRDFFVSFEAVQVRDNTWGIFFKAACANGNLCLTKDNNGNWIGEEKIAPAIWCEMSCKQ